MKCNPSFFGMSELPVLEISKDKLEELARASTEKGLTVTGVQKKLSLHLSDDDSARLTLVDYPAGYILKPQTEDFDNLPEAEDLVMDIADMMGVRTVPHGLIETDGGWAYITQRVDRAGGEIFAMEDFCQISGRLTEDKYKGSYEKCAEIIRSYSTRFGFDLSEFYLRLLVCFVTGNSDMHLKNFSLIEAAPASREFVLSPAYDLLPVNLVMPEDNEETALTLNGKKSNLKRLDFIQFAERIALPPKAAENMIESVAGKIDDAVEMCGNSLLPDAAKDSMNTLMRSRVKRLKK